MLMMEELSKTSPGFVIAKLTPAEVEGFVRISKSQLRLLVESGAMTVDQSKHELHFLAGYGATLFYGGEPLGLVIPQQSADSEPLVLSLNITRGSSLAKRRKNAWGRYVNFFYAYTLPMARRMGHARALAVAVEERAAALGYHRIKSLAGTLKGYHLHRTLRHDFWGVTPEGELVVDAPLLAWTGAPSPSGVPVEARQVARGRERPMTPDEIAAALRHPRFVDYGA
jgi:GNAT superfamily N-acetyltransferase